VKVKRGAAVRTGFVSFFILLSAIAHAGEPAKAPADPKAAAKAPAAPAKAAAPAAPKVEDPADKAPVRALDEGGILFSPGIAKNVRKYTPKTTPGKDKYEVLFVGPGVAVTEKAKLMPNSGSGWTFKAGPESTTGKNVTGLELMELMPSVLLDYKPGIVVFVGVAGRPKFQATDKQDWNDLSLLCLKFGAVPVYAIPAADSDDDPLRWSLRGAASTMNVPAVDGRVGPYAERLQPLMKLIEQYIYGVSPAAKAAEPVEE
jgi:hypothetical protein